HSPAEAWTNRQHSGSKRRDEVFACSGSNNGIVCSGNRRSVIGDKHQNHVEEISRKARQILLEPQQANRATNSKTVFDHGRNFDSVVFKFFTTVIRNGACEVCRRANETLLNCLVDTHGNARCLWNFKLLNHAVGEQALMYIGNHVAEFVERAWYKG